jgi:broad specificity phosphatase PhoE
MRVRKAGGRVYLAWHGQTKWNLSKGFNGSTDTFLNQRGLKQTERQAQNLKGIPFNACSCSSLTRGKPFCEAIYPGLAVLNGRLAEIGCSELEGTEKTPKAMKSFRNAVQNGPFGTESFEAFTRRNWELCEKIRQEHKRETSLIVTHAAYTRSIDHYFKGMPTNYDFSRRVVNEGELLLFEG